MAPENMEVRVSLVMVVAALVFAGAAAQSSDCSTVLISMSPCLNYITGNSSTPSSGCCSRLTGVVRSQPECLCQALNAGGSSLGININQTLALQLPAACRVQTPPITRCNAASPTENPAETPEAPSEEPVGPGSKAGPTTENRASEGSSVQLSKLMLFVLLVSGIYASF